jgi:hypothetical protein
VVAEALRAAGARVEIHDDHFGTNALDEDWLPEIGARGWLLVSQDESIQRRPAERLALQSAGVGAFLVSAGGLGGPEKAALLVACYPRWRDGRCNSLDRSS